MKLICAVTEEEPVLFVFVLCSMLDIRSTFDTVMVASHLSIQVRIDNTDFAVTVNSEHPLPSGLLLNNLILDLRVWVSWLIGIKAINLHYFCFCIK